MIHYLKNISLTEDSPDKFKEIILGAGCFWGVEKRGEIKQGNFADIIIWDADPLEPSSMPEYVFINGESIDLTTRSSRLRDRYTSDPEKPNTYRD